jgi:hypothetical protein
VIGRFCLTYDTGREALPKEPVEITVRRVAAIEKLRAAFELNRARVRTVFPLIRLLLENRDAGAAVALADAFQQTRADQRTADMLTTLAAFAAGDIPGAERAIVSWLAAEDPAGRRRVEDLNWLLQRRERSAYRALNPAERERYEARFWRYADALYLTPGNETRAEHFARHARNELIRTAPPVRGAHSWGEDVAQINIRYGPPEARSRDWSPGSIGSEPRITEHFHPEQRIYAPPQLDSVLRVRPRPALGWPMDTVRSVSGHAPSSFRRMLPLDQQATVFRQADRLWLRVDGRALADTTSAHDQPAIRGLIVLDGALNELARVQDTTRLRGDTLDFAMELALPPGAAFYSAEVLELESRLAARARFPIEFPADSTGLFLSDVLIAAAYPASDLPSARTDIAIRPSKSLVLPLRAPFGVFAEVDLGTTGPDTLSVQFEIRGIDGSPAVIRAARWLGQTLGLSERESPTRLSWEVEVAGSGQAPIAMTIDPRDLDRGRYLIELAITDRKGRRAVVTREILMD